jgi:23S rRNA (uracil1939-C5)-methyltransferase
MVTEVQVHIESMAFKGYGVARRDGIVHFIPHAVSGDKAWIKIIDKKKNYSIGKLIQLIEPSPWRVNPPCPFFGICGGCQWQHIHNSIQVDLKKEILKKVLEKIGGLKETPPIGGLPSHQPYGYRARVQLKVNPVRNSSRALNPAGIVLKCNPAADQRAIISNGVKGEAIGYFQEGSHRIVDIDHCLIAHPLINQMISYLRMSPPFFFQMEEIEINVSPEEGKGIFILHPLSLHQEMKHFLKEFLHTHPILKGIAVARKKGFTLFGDPYLNSTISFDHLGEKKVLKVQISPGSFFQVNLEQNQTLIRTVLEFSNVIKEDKILDLYSGVGNLTLPLAIASKEVWGIEENRVAVEDARFNAERNGIQNCNFIAGRVEDILENWRRKKPDLIILDPPRMGCKTVLDQVVRLKPKKIVYVSCEPTTFSRDLRLFSKAGYHLQRLGLVDMFPQTYHMEVIGLLH